MLNFIVKHFVGRLMKRLKDKKDARREDVHRFDCRENRWGHACYMDKKPLDEEGKTWGCSGALCPPVSVGDEVIKEFTKGSMILRFTEVNNWRDPRDGFNGKLEVVGYLADVGEKEVTEELASSALIMLEGRTPESHPEQYACGNSVLERVKVK